MLWKIFWCSSRAAWWWTCLFSLFQCPLLPFSRETPTNIDIHWVLNCWKISRTLQLTNNTHFTCNMFFRFDQFHSSEEKLFTSCCECLYLFTAVFQWKHYEIKTPNLSSSYNECRIYPLLFSYQTPVFLCPTSCANRKCFLHKQHVSQEAIKGPEWKPSRGMRPERNYTQVWRQPAGPDHLTVCRTECLRSHTSPRDLPLPFSLSFICDKPSHFTADHCSRAKHPPTSLCPRDVSTLPNGLLDRLSTIIDNHFLCC